VAADFEVGDHVVDADKWHVEGLCGRPRRRADRPETGAETGALREGDAVDIVGVRRLSIVDCCLGSAGEHPFDDLRERLTHVFGGLAWVNPAAVGLVGVGLDQKGILGLVIEGRAGGPRGALDAENAHIASGFLGFGLGVVGDLVAFEHVVLFDVSCGLGAIVDFRVPHRFPHAEGGIELVNNNLLGVLVELGGEAVRTDSRDGVSSSWTVSKRISVRCNIGFSSSERIVTSIGSCSLSAGKL